MSGTTSWTQRGAAGLCLLSLGTVGFLAGNSYSSVEMAERGIGSLDAPVAKAIVESNESYTGKRYSTAGNFDGPGFVDPLLLGVSSFCGTDGDFESCTLGYLGGGNSAAGSVRGSLVERSRCADAR